MKKKRIKRFITLFALMYVVSIIIKILQNFIFDEHVAIRSIPTSFGTWGFSLIMSFVLMYFDEK